MKNSSVGLRIFVSAVCVVAVATIGLGLYFAGSPMAERARRMDDQRTQRLSSLTYQIDNFYRQQYRLPINLDELSGSRFSTDKISTLDPETNAQFEYSATATSTYELCATFASDSTASNQYGYPQPYGGYPDFWHHGTGRVCFTGKVHDAVTGQPL